MAIRFSIVKVKSDFRLINKRLNMELNNSLALDGRSKTQLQQTDRKDLINGGLKTEQTTDIAIQQQRQRIFTKSRDDDIVNSRKLDRAVRKEPRFLSAE